MPMPKIFGSLQRCHFPNRRPSDSGTAFKPCSSPEQLKRILQGPLRLLDGTGRRQLVQRLLAAPHVLARSEIAGECVRKMLPGDPAELARIYDDAKLTAYVCFCDPILMLQTLPGIWIGGIGSKYRIPNKMSRGGLSLDAHNNYLRYVEALVMKVQDPTP